MSSQIFLKIATGKTESEIAFNAKRLIIAGWTGRDREAMEHHIAELEAIGIKRPATTPIFYRASAARLTTGGNIEATGGNSSGEVEFVIYNHDGDWLIGVGSDHTDRQVETYNITVSKQMCDKPVAPKAWAYTNIKTHWDQIRIGSEILENGSSVEYQSGTVAAMLPPDELVAKFEETSGLKFSPGDVMMGGTLAAIGGIRPAPRFEFQLSDPVLERTIGHGYDVGTLPVEG